MNNMRYLIVVSFTLLLAQEPITVVPDTAAHEQMVLVPNVFGYRYEQAIDTLMKLGLSLGESVVVASDHEPGHVIEQQPRAGSVVPVETEFSLSVSSGPRIMRLDTVVVPQLRGRRVEEAEAMLERARLQLGERKYIAHDAEPGTVVEQRPSAGTRVTVNSAVHLTIATTDPYRYVIVPLVIGQKLQRATEMINSAQLNVGRISKEVTEATPGTVIEQNPRGETRVRVHTSVNLVVAGRRTSPLPWIIGGSFIVLGVAGYFALRHLKKPEEHVESARPKVRFEPKSDHGDHYVDSKERLQSDFEVSFLPFPDAGMQTIDLEGPLIVDERGYDE